MRLGFLGAGKLATALARGWLAAGLLTTDTCQAADPSVDACEDFTRATGCPTSTSNAVVVRESDALVLAVKPQSMAALLDEIRPLVQPRHLVVSVAAGVTLARLAQGLGGHRRLVRVMPNTPALVGASAAGFSPDEGATRDDMALIEKLFTTVGRAYRVPEHLLDAVTGLSGSGPAFVYLIVEALADGGVRVGLPRDIALALAAQTVLGGAKMVLETKEHPGALKDAVASPGGTTIAGLHALERAGVRGALMDAVEAATARARELGSS
jgi:pyrroline-5-carboxylate reductase